MKRKKPIDPVIPLLIAYLTTIGLTIAWEILTNK
jgi:hypothetical protein